MTISSMAVGDASKKSCARSAPSAAHSSKPVTGLNAGAVYHVLLDESVKGYDDIVQQIDDDGNVAGVVDEFVEALGKCLEKSKADSANAARLVEAFYWMAISKDIEIGGMGFASSAADIIIKAG